MDFPFFGRILSTSFTMRNTKINKYLQKNVFFFIQIMLNKLTKLLPIPFMNPKQFGVGNYSDPPFFLVLFPMISISDNTISVIYFFWPFLSM